MRSLVTIAAIIITACPVGTILIIVPIYVHIVGN